VFGVTRMTKAVLPHMRAQGAGRIIKILSILGLIPQPYVVAYSASKHPVEWYSESVDMRSTTTASAFCSSNPQ
jgi:short-subunit dehydrogenase